MVRARWSPRILDECFRSILKQRPDLDSQALARTRELMNEAVVVQVLTEQAGALKNPPRTVPDLLRTLHDLGLVQAVAKLRELYGTSGPTDPTP